MNLSLDAEEVPHNCVNGHRWYATMFPISNLLQVPWRYLDKKQKTCPQCGASQTENEPI